MEVWRFAVPRKTDFCTRHVGNYSVVLRLCINCVRYLWWWKWGNVGGTVVACL